jgi:trehalose 6-phosphate synthase/phosphatase
MTKNRSRRLVVVSNRLPVTISRKGERWSFQESTGGLVAAFGPILRRYSGVWVGWPGADGSGTFAKELKAQSERSGYTMQPVHLSPDEREKFYLGFANEIIWPLFHDLQNFCNFDAEYMAAYKSVNRKFAAAVREVHRPDDYVWVQDYHLMDVARALRASGWKGSVGFFLHIPFPPPDIFLKLPWRRDILEGLLEFELVGFQTPRDQLNFVSCVQALFADATIQLTGDMQTVRVGRRKTRIGSFPISIDTASLHKQAASRNVTRRLRDIRARLPNRQFILGVDRLDYTKGIPNKLRAFRRALELFPDLHRKVSLIQILSPSREGILRYNELKSEVERLVGRINGQFTESGWVPIHYIYRNVDQADVLAWYRAADVALVTPLKDGMNLVAKEFVACKVRESGALILSEFAGSATQMARGALLVNPYNLDEVAQTIHTALTMPKAKKTERLARLRRNVDQEDIFWWVDAFLQAARLRLSLPEPDTPPGIDLELETLPPEEVRRRRKRKSD